MSEQTTHICSDCLFETTYPAIVDHVRVVHNREPLCGPVLAIGDLVRRQGINWRVTKIHENGTYDAIPLISLQVEYRVDSRQWEVTPDLNGP